MTCQKAIIISLIVLHLIQIESTQKILSAKSVIYISFVFWLVIHSLMLLSIKPKFMKFKVLLHDDTDTLQKFRKEILELAIKNVSWLESQQLNRAQIFTTQIYLVHITQVIDPIIEGTYWWENMPVRSNIK